MNEKLKSLFGFFPKPDPNAELPIDICLKCGLKLKDKKVGTRLDHDHNYHPSGRSENPYIMFARSFVGILLIFSVGAVVVISVGIWLGGILDELAYDQEYVKFHADCDVDFTNLEGNITKSGMTDDLTKQFQKRWNECKSTSFMLYRENNGWKQEYEINTDNPVAKLVHEFDRFKLDMKEPVKVTDLP